MSEGSTDQQAVKAELRQAIRRDHAAMKADLARRIRRDNRQRRKAAIRTTVLAVAALMILSGTALAAGEAFGVIDLGGDVTAVQASTIPVWNGTTGTFITGTGEPGSYIYHLTGGSDPEAQGCPNDPHPTNNIYVTSTRPLAASELKEILDSELSHETKHVTVTEIMQELKEGKTPAKAKPLPPGVTGVSNGCPTPGVAGQSEAP